MLVFQPAEETGSGAKAMLADGAFEPLTPDAIYAVHTTPHPVGQLATTAGGLMAGRSRIEVTMRGTGNLPAAARHVQAALEAVGTVPAETITQPASQDVILVQLFGGASRVDGGLVIRGQVMTASPETRAAAKKAVLEGIADLKIPNVALKAEFDDRFMAGVNNDPDLVARASGAIGTLGDEVELLTVSSVIPAFSEDFGSFQYLAPGVMFFLGVSNPEAGTVGMPHTGSYVADDAAIGIGVRALNAVLLERLLN
jgi:metal-dependent amidase/aminoacylase/carboxypeptidase family protein